MAHVENEAVERAFSGQERIDLEAFERWRGIAQEAPCGHDLVSLNANTLLRFISTIDALVSSIPAPSVESTSVGGEAAEEIANRAVEANLNADGTAKYGTAQGYACALEAVRIVRSAPIPPDGSEAVRLREALEAVAVQAEHHWFCAAAIPAEDKSMVFLGKAFAKIKDIARAALAPEPRT